MPPVIASLLLKVQSFFKDMAGNIMIIYGEKGIEPFKKPLLIALPTLLIIYSAVYSPLGRKLDGSAARVRNMETVAQYAADYLEAKSRLSGYQRRLPLAKDKDEWLNYIITNTAKSYGISFDGVSAQKETEVGNFYVVSREITVTTTYAKLGKWLAEIENSPIFLRIVELSLRRDENSPGTIKVTFRLSTIIPRFRAAGGGS
ncbi:MAG: type 4a pilus biogenesis protein PilO [Elusimicrobia bacterium]|jgi:Tfp pilus assembly protein PilO|nr:type 4a pilus biogenesis protein PilO [Elusimicrobiota bacterium]